MFGKRPDPAVAARLALLGGELLAARCDGVAPPAGMAVLIVGADGRTRRATGATVMPGKGEAAWCWHPGPYAIEVAPFAAAPEAGLRIECVIVADDASREQHRFELFLSSEVTAGTHAVPLPAFAALLQGALRGALEGGTLELPPCTAVDEWHAFRAGVNELLYTRFGLIVTDCLPVDLGETVDFAALLRARALSQVALVVAEPEVVSPAAPAPVAQPDDAAALRRLFLELPALAARLRGLPLPDGAFAAHRDLLQRLALVSVQVDTMPSLALAAPGQALHAAGQHLRTSSSIAAVAALDEGWRVLAAMRGSGFAALGDELDRIVANLECHVAARRADPRDRPERREPT
ncbi:hypothetical protein GCM10011572_50820 [Pseudoduganella buxea]|uniref:Uncharacterized protein n=3 Tax=Pseudoduganella buxea TaxID=1949069 RepID=A0ABQ1LFV2_9BURK|nr:hypothetical protein GCM10011572_50820 [Pseudoduganella buxea]